MIQKLKYISLYLCITILTAVGMIFVVDPYSMKNAGTVSESTEISTPFDSVVSEFMATSGIEINAAASITSDTFDEIYITGRVLVDMHDGAANLALDGAVDIEISGKVTSLYFRYIDNIIYLDMFDGHYMLNVSDISEMFDYVTTLFDISVPDINLSLDTESLMDSLSGMNETVVGGKRILVCDLFGMDVSIYTDASYRIEQIVVPEITFGNISINPYVSLSYLSEFDRVTKPTTRYIDISSIADIVRGAVDLLKDGKVALNANIRYKDFALPVDMQIDYSDGLKVYAKTSIFDRFIECTLVGQTVYVSVDNINISCNIADIDILLDKLSGLGLDVSMVQELVTKVSDIDINNIDLGSIDLSSISLGALKDIIENNGTYTISIEGVGDVIVDAYGPLSRIRFNDKDLDLDVKFKKNDFNITVPNRYYINAIDILDLVLSLKDMFAKSTFTGYINYNNYVVNYGLNILDDGFEADLRTTLFGKEISAQIVNDRIYLSALGMSVSGTFDDITNILDKLDIENPLDDLDINDMLDDILDANTHSSLITSYVRDNNVTTITLYNGLVVTLDTTNDLDIDVKYEQLHITGSIIALDAQVEVNTPESYVELDNTYRLIRNIINYVKLGQFNYNINANIQGFNVTGFIGYNDGALSASLALNIKGVDIYVKLIDGEIYIETMGVNLIGSLDDIDWILDSLDGVVNIPQNVREVITSIINDGIDKDTLSKLIDTKSKDLDIEEILAGLSVDYTKDNLTIHYNDIDVSIDLIYNTMDTITVSMDEIDVVIDLCDKQDVLANASYYFDISNLAPYMSNIIDVVTSKEFGGMFNIDVSGMNIPGIYNLSINNGITLVARTNLYGLDASVYLLDNTIYVDLAGVKLYLPISEIDSVIEYINKFASEKISLGGSADLSTLGGLVKELSMVGRTLNVKLDGGNHVSFTFGSNITLSARFAGINAQVVLGKSSFVAPDIVTNEFIHYSALTNFVDAIYSVVVDKAVNLSATATVYEGDSVRFAATCALALDLNNGLKMFGHADLSGEQDMQFDLCYDGQMMYINFDKLKVKMDKNCLFNLLYMAFNMLGIDTSTVDFLKDVSDKNDVSMDNLQAIIPSLDSSIPLGLIDVIRNLSLEPGKLTITLKGDKFSIGAMSDITVSIYEKDGKLVAISFDDFYTGVTESERFDLDIDVLPLTSVGTLTDDEKASYIDMSSVHELVRAFINTSALNDYHVTGNLAIKLMYKDNDAITLNIPVDLRVKLVDTKPIIAIRLGPIPVVTLVNDDVPYRIGNVIDLGENMAPGENRILDIYIMDDFAYFYRSELIPRLSITKPKLKYEKSLKLSVEELLNDPMIVLSYGVGLKSYIMSEIDGAVYKALHRETPINFGNILINYWKSNKVINNTTLDIFNLILNLQEIANNADLDTLTLNIGTSKVNDLDYITHGELLANLPFTKNLELDITSSDLTLADIGTILDISDITSYINEYNASGKLSGQKWQRYEDQKWGLDSETTYTLTFEENGGESVSDQVLHVGDSITLPVYDNLVITNNNDKDTYRFDGWFTTSTFDEETKFVDTTMTPGDKVLYAKWTLINSIREVRFYVDGRLYESQIGPVGTPIRLVHVDDKYTYEGNIRYLNTFSHWEDASGHIVSTIPSESIDVYAVYNVTRRWQEYAFVINQGPAGDTLTYRVYEGESVLEMLPRFADMLDSSGLLVVNDNGVTYKYSFDGWYLDNTYLELFDYIMPQHDTAVFAKWNLVDVIEEHYLTIIDNGQTVYQKLIGVGDAINVLNSGLRVDKDTLWYLDEQYSRSITVPQTMGHEDITLHIRNKYTYTYTSYDGAGNVHNAIVTTLSAYQGEKINLAAHAPYDIKYYTAEDHLIDYIIEYKFGAPNILGVAIVDYVMPNSDIVIDCPFETNRIEYHVITFDLYWYAPVGWGTSKGTILDRTESLPSVSFKHGTTVDLTEYKAFVRAQKYFTAYTWNATSWRTSRPWDSFVGSGMTSIVLTEDITLFPVWTKA